MRYRAMVGWLAPGALAVLVMLPRLASSQFGLLDDGLTLETGRETLGRWSSVLFLIPETGRFSPAYWLVYSAFFGVVGARPLAFFALNVVVLSGLLTLLARLVRMAGGTPLEAALAVIVFAVCGPAIEAFYTLSKAEPLQMTWIGVSLLATAASASEPRGGRRAVAISLAGIALTVAYTTKETSFVLIPVSLGWAAIEWSWPERRQACTRFANSFATINVAAAAASLLLRWRYATLPIAYGTYTGAYALQSETVGPAVFRIAAWILRDFLFLVPLTAAVLLAVRHARAESRLILYAAVWMIGWLAVFAPWPATFEYYLLPSAFGAAAFAGTVAGRLWLERDRRHRLATRVLAWSVMAASALLWVPAIVNAAADARIQVAVDRANADLVDFLAGLPAGSRIVLNTTEANEYVHELALHLTELKKRPDLLVQPIGTRPDVVMQHAGAPATAARSVADLVLITATIANQPIPTVRIAVHEAGVSRDIGRLTEILSGGGDLIYTTERHVAFVEVGVHRLLCHVATPPFLDATYCPGTRGVLDARTFTYGWQVHRLARPVSTAKGST